VTDLEYAELVYTRCIANRDAAKAVLHNEEAALSEAADRLAELKGWK
jgi:hypothetical protein